MLCLWVLLPLAWVILLSVKSLPDGTQRYIWPHQFVDPIYAHYAFVIDKSKDAVVAFKNSVLVTGLTVIASTITAVLAGYALVHLKTPWRGVVIGLLVASLFFPTRVTALIGIYNIQNRLGLINETWSLMLPYTALSVAISVFIMRGVFETVPKELVDSARIDGANSLRVLGGIMLPLVRNGIVVVIIVNFVAAWGEYLLALTLMNDADKRTLPVFIVSTSGGIGASPLAADGGALHHRHPARADHLRHRPALVHEGSARGRTQGVAENLLAFPSWYWAAEIASFSCESERDSEDCRALIE